MREPGQSSVSVGAYRGRGLQVDGGPGPAIALCEILIGLLVGLRDVLGLLIRQLLRLGRARSMIVMPSFRATFVFPDLIGSFTLLDIMVGHSALL